MNKQRINLTDYLNSPAHEAFRVLSINLGLNRKNVKLKVISIISYNPGEGKTSVAVNLSIVAAKSGNRVLYVDADLRRPSQLKRHGNESVIGLTDLLENREFEDIVCQTSIENLRYVTAGKLLVDPVEFLSGQVFDEFLESLSEQYDMVFLDSPSLGNYVDGAIIASKASGVLIISRAHKTSYKNIERIKWQMENVGANIVGIVMNRVDRLDYKSYFLLHNNYKYLKRNLRGMKVNQ